jgi:dienelactone hydrolase
MQFVSFVLERSKWISLLIIACAIVLILLGKTTWQYYPLYLLGIFWLVLIIVNYFNKIEVTSTLSKWTISIGIVLLVITILAAIILPTMKLPKPSGDYEIGTRTFEVEDKTRKEIYTEDPSDNRKIKYQVWYPTEDIKNSTKAKWISGGKEVTRGIASSMSLPGFVLDHTATIESNSYLNAPISDALDNYPVVVISHGWQGFRELHTDYAEELASNGFIVVSIDHTYGSLGVKFDDGEVALLNKELLPSDSKPSIFDPAAALLVSTYGEDVRTVLNDLENTNTTHQDLKGKLDLDSVGLLGHSTGGGGDVYLALEDTRIKAFMGLDAWVKPVDPQKLQQGLPIPSLFLRSEQWSIGPNNDALAILFEESDNIELIQMNQTNHVDFAMTYMYSPLSKYVGFTGELGGRKSSDIQRDFILAFFDQTLKNNDSINNDYLKEIVQKYKAVEFVGTIN